MEIPNQSSDNGGELTGNFNQKKKSDVLQAYKSPLLDKCCRRDYFFNKHAEYCELVGKHDFPFGKFFLVDLQ